VSSHRSVACLMMDIRSSLCINVARLHSEYTFYDAQRICHEAGMRVPSKRDFMNALVASGYHWCTSCSWTAPIRPDASSWEVKRLMYDVIHRPHVLSSITDAILLVESPSGLLIVRKMLTHWSVRPSPVSHTSVIPVLISTALMGASVSLSLP
jgi:hypothetical protein